MTSGYEQTSIENVPKEWEIRKIEEAVKITKGKKPNQLFDEKEKDCLPYLTTDFMRSNSNVEWCKNDDLNIVKVDKDDVIMIWDGSNSGDVFVGFEGALASTMVKLQTSENLDNRFLYYFLITKFDFLRGTTSGTGVPHISKNVFNNISVPLPPLAEQRRIIDVLSGVDDAIQRVNEAIAKTKRLKKGLLQKLLREGIGHKEFRETRIGKIPKTWELLHVEDIVEKNKNAIKTGPFGSSLKKEFFVEEGYKVYGQENVIPDDFSIGDYYIDENRFSRLRQYEIKPDDVLISLVGTFGKVSVVPEKIERGIINPRLLKITPDKTRVLSTYLKYFLTSSIAEKQMRMLAHGGTMGILNTRTIKSLLFVIPSLPEQEKICSVFSTLDRKLELDAKRKEKLERIKKGLMNDLLTGRRRVKVAM